MTIKVNLPDGNIAQFPDGTPHDVMEKALQEHYAAKAPAASEKSVGGFVQNIGSDAYDTAAGIAGGLYAGGKKLITDPVGAGGDVLNAIDTGGKVAAGGVMNLADMVSGKPNSIAMSPRDKQAQELASGVGAGLKDKYYDHLGDTLYNHPVQSAADISTLAYGGEGLAARVLGEGALATKALGKAAAVTNPLNAVIKPVEAVRGVRAESGALKQMRNNAPSLDQVVKEKNALYGALDNAGIKFDAAAHNQMLAKVSSKLKTFSSVDAPMTVNIVNGMMKKAGTSPSFRDVEDVLIRAKRVLREPFGNHADKAAAHILVDEVDSFFNNAPVLATSNGSIPPYRIAEVAKQARDLARRHIIAREIGEIERKSKWYPSGDESGTRNQFSSFGKRQGKSLTPTEEKAALKVVRREGVHGLLGSGGSKLAQVGLLVAGLPTAGILPTAVAGGLSLGARAASAAMTNAKAKQFMQTVLAGREAQNAAMKSAKRLKAPTRGILLGGQGLGLLSDHR